MSSSISFILISLSPSSCIFTRKQSNGITFNSRSSSSSSVRSLSLPTSFPLRLSAPSPSLLCQQDHLRVPSPMSSQLLPQKRKNTTTHPPNGGQQATSNSSVTSPTISGVQCYPLKTIINKTLPNGHCGFTASPGAKQGSTLSFPMSTRQAKAPASHKNCQIKQGPSLSSMSTKQTKAPASHKKFQSTVPRFSVINRSPPTRPTQDSLASSSVSFNLTWESGREEEESTDDDMKTSCTLSSAIQKQLQQDVAGDESSGEEDVECIEISSSDTEVGM